MVERSTLGRGAAVSKGVATGAGFAADRGGSWLMIANAKAARVTIPSVPAIMREGARRASGWPLGATTPAPVAMPGAGVQEGSRCGVAGAVGTATVVANMDGS